MKWTELNWTERLAKIWNLGNVKLQTRNCKLRFAVSHEKPDAKGLYIMELPRRDMNCKIQTQGNLVPFLFS